MAEVGIFLSYSAKDVAIAERLQQKLEGAGLVVWRDQSRLETDWSREIALALAKSSALCLLWTEHAARSKWVEHEWLTARALEKLIVPCTFRAAPALPEPLLNLQGVNFQDVNDGGRRLVERIRRAPSFAVKYDYTVLPSNSYVPFNPDPDFTGRQSELVELFLKVIGNLNKVGVNQVGTVGMGGIGKTQLVVEFAYRFGFAFDGIHWIQAADPDEWLAQFVRLARDRLELKVGRPEGAEANEQYLLALQNYCKAHPRMLLIMDNVPEPRRLNSDSAFHSRAGLTPLTLGCNLLFTTRKHFQLPGVAAQAVDKLSEEAAYALLTGRRDPASPPEAASARAICSAVGYLPLALVLAAGYLNKYRAVSFADYYAELAKNKLAAVDAGAVSDEELATRHVAAVGVTLESQWEMLTDETARRLFRLAGLLPESAIIPTARLAMLAGIEPRASGVGCPLEKALVLLHDLNLVERLATDAGAIRLHPLVRDLAARHLTPEEERPKYEAEAAAELKAVYDSPLSLEREYLSRGIDSVIEDVKIAADWSEGRTRESHELRLLHRVLDRERHHLAGDKLKGAAPVSLLQQMHHRARHMGLEGLAERFLEAGRGGAPVFKAAAFSELEDPAQLRTLVGHAGPVTAVGMSADGRRVLSGSQDKTLILWDVESGTAITTLQGHSEAVTCVGMSADGRRAVSGSYDKTLIVWDLEGGKAIRRLEHEEIIATVGLSADGRRALSGTRHDFRYSMPLSWGRYTLTLWDVDGGGVIRSFRGGGVLSNHASLSADGRRAISDGLVVWDVDTGEEISSLSTDERIGAVSLSADGRLAVSGSDYGRVRLWDAETGRLLHRFQGRGRETGDVRLSADGRLLLGGFDDGSLMLWEISRGGRLRTKLLRVFKAHSEPVNSVGVSADGRRAVSASSDGTLVVWDLEEIKAGRANPTHPTNITDVSLSPDGRRALVASSRQNLALWNAESGEALDQLKGPFTFLRWSTLEKVSLSPDGGRALLCFTEAATESELAALDLGTGKPLAIFNAYAYPGDIIPGGIPVTIPYKRRVTCIAWAADGHVIAGAEDGTLTLFNRDGRMLQIFKRHSGPVTGVSVSADGRRAVSSSDDKTLIVWDVEGGAGLRTLEGHSDQVTGVSVSADGRRALSGSNDRTLILWDVEGGQKLRTFCGHSDRVTGVCLSADGRRAVSRSEDRSLILWDAAEGKAVRRLYLQKSASCLAMAGRTVVYGDNGGLVGFLSVV